MYSDLHFSLNGKKNVTVKNRTTEIQYKVILLAPISRTQETLNVLAIVSGSCSDSLLVA